MQSRSGDRSYARFIDAISDGLRQSMERYDNLVLMGQDIAEYGGVFKITEGFVEKFGKPRVRNTPICESAIAGAGLGLTDTAESALVARLLPDELRGSGFGLHARPIGAYVIRDGEVRWEPAFDLNRAIVIGQVLLLVAVLLWRAAGRRR